MRILPLLLLPSAILCAAPEAGAPRISFIKSHHNLGIVNADQTTHCAFTVTNTGGATLKISRIEPSCGCTSTNLGKDELRQGESTQIQVDFDPKNFLGPVKKLIVVHSNDPANPALTLSFEAKVVRDVMAEPANLHLHELLRTQSKQAAFRLVSGNGKPVEVREIRCPGAPYLSFSQRKEGLDVLVTIHLDGTKLPAQPSAAQERIIVRTTHPKYDPIVEYLDWSVKADEAPRTGPGDPTPHAGKPAPARPAGPPPIR
ncbi:hypothetical protein GETHLI_12620 [Geothrix limicola]|uniref:DUF1573 domain-containing protein n=1 Tax=Geothrix limicola TaxID=2927978 RepID=A0ABQ5QD41_9BACT|nr:DUF1573 domain-containing protein [Geothrix limicola]GLH72760.1 hypothetical protein GETHLI_12620 [Geothrix limicola]